MTSSKGNIFRVTGHLFREFTGPQWIPHAKGSDAELWCFFDLRLNKRLSKQSWGWWLETPSRPLRRHRNVSLSCLTYSTLPSKGEEYFLIWTYIGMYCKVDMIIRNSLERLTPFCVCRQYVSCLIWLYRLSYFNHPFTTNLGFWKFCVEDILTKNASPLDRDKVTMDLMLINMKNDTFFLISTIILPKMFTLCYPVNLETLAVIYWNSCVALRY